MRFAIQIGGEIRNWETASVLFREYRDILANYDVQVDYFLVGWDSEYTRKCEKLGLFDFCEKYQLIEVPPESINPSFTAKFLTNNTGRSVSLYGWATALYLSYYQRKKFQNKTKVNYNMVWFTRPDIYVPYELWSKIVDEIQWQKSQKPTNPDRSDFCIYSFRPVRGTVQGSNILHYFSDDLKICGDQYAMDLFSHSFHLHYLNQDPSFIGTYHSLPYLTVMKYGLTYRTDTISSKKWKILRRNDGKMVLGKGDKPDVLIDERYLVSKRMENLHNSIVI